MLPIKKEKQYEISLLDFSDDIQTIGNFLPSVMGSNGSGFLCCLSVIVADGYVGVSISF